MKNTKEIRTLFVYNSYREGVKFFYESYIKRLCNLGYDVEGFCITIDSPGNTLFFNELDKRYKSKDRNLFKKYGELKKATEGKDVLLLFNGSNLHPDFLKELNTLNVYCCFDDPESSEKLSKPVAKYFDACLVGNIACIQDYLSWGARNVKFRPLTGFQNLNEVLNLRLDKDIETCLICDKLSPFRIERLNYIETFIPGIFARGNGWDKGRISDKDVIDVYCRSKIGINIHNSLGPVNLRTYTLPLFNIMQICDNKFFLGHIFELNKEVVGFIDIEEVPDLVRFYSENDKVRAQIALAGRERVLKDYTEEVVWERQMKYINSLL